MVLNGWKQIANHIGLGVRTVQRWESECGLPVRRPKGTERGSVLALSEELDAWTHCLRTRRNRPPASAPLVDPDALARLIVSRQKLSTLAAELRTRAGELRMGIEAARTRIERLSATNND